MATRDQRPDEAGGHPGSAGSSTGSSTGRHAGRHAGSTPERSVSRGRLALLAVGITATLVAWGLLVKTAIDFGGDARTGETLSWAFLALATLGAIACLLLALVLGQALFSTLRGVSVTPSDDGHLPGGRRARR